MILFNYYIYLKLIYYNNILLIKYMKISFYLDLIYKIMKITYLSMIIKLFLIKF